MKFTEIIELIPEKLFDELSVETEIDTQVKKLTGETMFKLILFSMLSSDKLSLRVMEMFLSSASFKYFNRRTRRARNKKTKSPFDCRFNSIRDRICTMDVDYFERLFEAIFTIYNKELKEESELSKLDSTFISLAASLFSIGMENGDKSKRFVKYSIILKGSLPCKAKVFFEQSYVSEELALAEAINDTELLIDDIIVFDRGMQSRNSFDRFTGDNKYFVTRGKVGIDCRLSEQIEVVGKPANSTVTITNDEIGFLFNRQKKMTAHRYRVIKGVIDASGEEICFVTNLLNEDAYTIARLYKDRWEIELFFKFIKQHLNTKHLVSRDENGIKVMLYMTMILATLIIVYKKKNKIKGFKMAKLALEIELDNEIMKEIVKLCGGDPKKAAYLWRGT